MIGAKRIDIVPLRHCSDRFSLPRSGHSSIIEKPLDEFRLNMCPTLRSDAAKWPFNRTSIRRRACPKPKRMSPSGPKNAIGNIER